MGCLQHNGRDNAVILLAFFGVLFICDFMSFHQDFSYIRTMGG